MATYVETYWVNATISEKVFQSLSVLLVMMQFMSTIALETYQIVSRILVHVLILNLKCACMRGDGLELVSM